MIWEQLKKLSPHPTRTLENHRPEGLIQSLEYLKTHPID
jgi:hypothetical protein